MTSPCVVSPSSAIHPATGIVSAFRGAEELEETHTPKGYGPSLSTEGKSKGIVHLWGTFLLKIPAGMLLS